MKKLSKIKLNYLSQAEMSEKEQSMLIGGGYEGYKCACVSVCENSICACIEVNGLYPTEATNIVDDNIPEKFESRRVTEDNHFRGIKDW